MIDNFLEVAKLIAKFQSIEIHIKVVLVKYEIEQDKINKTLKNSYSVFDLIDIPYGHLIKRYKKISPNQVLNNRLENLKDERNFLVHQAFIANSTTLPDYLKVFAGVKLVKIDYSKLNAEVDECIGELIKQYHEMYKD
jgi:hypothetical protein